MDKLSLYSKVIVSKGRVTSVKALTVDEYTSIYFDKFNESGDCMDRHCVYCKDCSTFMDYELYYGFSCPKCHKEYEDEKLARQISYLKPIKMEE